ncbi:MAG TPA: peptidase MA family metallohydrolase [Anaerolineales bacterium]
MKIYIKVFLPKEHRDDVGKVKYLYNDRRDTLFAPRVICLMLFVIAVLFFSVIHASAQTEIELDMSAGSKFGEQITFTAKLKSPLQIQSASILIHDMTHATTHIQPVTFDQNGESEFRFDTRQNLIRPFATLLWRYELTLLDGSRMQSQSASIRYDDNRFGWHHIQNGSFNIHWYNGDPDFGTSALNAALAGEQKIAEFFPSGLSSFVDIFIYDNESDLSGALYGAGEDWVTGHADSAAGVITVNIEAGEGQNIIMEQRIPHELMHIILARQVGAGYKNIPAWLREGMAISAELYPNPEYERFLTDAAARDALIPIKDLCASFSPQIDSAFLAYAESRSFTNYLRGQYGVDGLLTLATAYADGVECERGPERAFGSSLAMLERDWRVTILGQDNIASTLGNFAPYIGLLCLVVFFPLIGIMNSMRKKGTSHGR